MSSVDAVKGSATNNPGVFISTDDGQSWTEITPADFPSAHARSVITFAPSDPNIIYTLTKKVA
ncbi:MAG: hypothetical protein U5J95_06120 [Balneolaceae bacterium]|nr:hypothetical protein [Balneolaceae bacterium]